MIEFGSYITAARAAALAKENGDKRPLAAITKEYEHQAASDAKCEVCDQPVWRFSGLGMCFTCTTGESDPSEDFELEATGAALEMLARQPRAWLPRPKAERVSCPICCKRVAKVGLQAHHKAVHPGQQQPPMKKSQSFSRCLWRRLYLEELRDGNDQQADCG